MTLQDVNDLKLCVDFMLKQHGVSHAKRAIELVDTLDKIAEVIAKTDVDAKPSN